MKKFNSIAQPDLLKKIQPAKLIRMLEPHRLFLAMKGFEVTETEAELDYLALAGILAQPDEEMSSDLVEALHLVGTFGVDEQFDRLLQAAANAGLDIDADVTAPELAVQLYLHDPQFLEQMDREQLFESRRTFDSYRAANPKIITPIENLPPDLSPLEAELDAYFESKKRGAGCRIIRRDSDTEVRFLIQHGQVCKREPSRKGRQSTCTFFRPEKTDVIIYDVVHNELRINARNLPDLRQYRALLGSHLFGDEERFVFAEKYTLEPLKNGSSSLVCQDVEGIEAVDVTNVEYHWGGALDHVEIHRGTDVFHALALRQRTIEREPEIRKAVFKIKLLGEKRARAVTIRAGNKSGYSRSEEAVLIENWLWLRGFVVTQSAGNDAEAEAALARA